MGFDDHDDSDERFGGRKDRRRPKRGRRRKDLVAEPETGTAQEEQEGRDQAEAPGFADPGLRALHAKGALVSLDMQVRGGKEATVYRAMGPDGPLAAKVYSDAEVGGFQADEVYLSGRYIGDRRLRKMLGDAKRRGLSPRLAHWVYHEYRMLWKLFDAGLRVPAPAVGPEPDAIVEAGRVVLMQWIGDEEAAPRLAEAQLDEDERVRAWNGATSLLAELLSLGLVHGDLSTYNLLWWDGEIVLIDLPQTVEVERNPHADELLARDVRSLCSSFRSFGIDQDPDLLLLDTRVAAGYRPSGRLTT